MFIWDEYKRRSNIRDHGFDFRWADQVLCQPHVLIPGYTKDGETRYLAVGRINGRFTTVVHTKRGDNYRIISIRSARDAERRAYKELYG